MGRTGGGGGNYTISTTPTLTPSAQFRTTNPQLSAEIVRSQMTNPEAWARQTGITDQIKQFSQVTGLTPAQAQKQITRVKGSVAFAPSSVMQQQTIQQQQQQTKSSSADALIFLASERLRTLLLLKTKQIRSSKRHSIGKICGETRTIRTR